MSIDKSMRIAVLGAGIMGAKIAKCYDSAGYEVILYSRTEKTLSRAEDTIGESKIIFTTDFEYAVTNSLYIVETVTENPDLKREIYEKIDALASIDAYISSNTSYMNIFELMPERRLPKTTIVHWFAPADILPLVEIIKCDKTLDETVNSMKSFHIECGKTPVVLNKFIPGFIINRLQSAMNFEIINLIDNGYCSVEDLDLAVKTSLMPRGLVLGVMQRMDFGGIDTTANGIKNGSFVPSSRPNDDNIISKLAESGDLGIKTGKGFYDYSNYSYDELVKERDKKLSESVKLAEKFINDPMGEIRKDI